MSHVSGGGDWESLQSPPRPRRSSGLCAAGSPPLSGRLASAWLPERRVPQCPRRGAIIISFLNPSSGPIHRRRCWESLQHSPRAGPTGRRRNRSWFLSFCRTPPAPLGHCTAIPSPAGVPGARAEPTAPRCGTPACDIHPTPSSGKQAAGRQGTGHRQARQAGRRPGTQRTGRPAQASRSCGKRGIYARARTPHTHAGSFVPGPRIYMRLARCNPGKARGRQAGQADQARPGRQAGATAGRQGRQVQRSGGN